MTANRSLHPVRWLFIVVPGFYFALITASAGAAPRGANDAVDRGLRWLASTQSRIGHWEAKEGRYPTAMTALAGMAPHVSGADSTKP